ncbi:hypothetical protein Tco_0265257 [Tanacetum coccineum]
MLFRGYCCLSLSTDNYNALSLHMHDKLLILVVDASGGYSFLFAVPGQMTHPVASLTLDSARAATTLSSTIPGRQPESWLVLQMLTFLLDANREPLSEDILGATTQRDTRSYYPKRYWELLPKEILGAITQRDIGMSYGKMEGASCTQRKVSMVPFVLSWGGNISSDSFLPSILLLVVIIVTVVIVVVILIVIVVVIVVVVVVVGGFSSILKLLFVILGFLRRIVFYYLLHQPLSYGNGFLQSLRL